MDPYLEAPAVWPTVYFWLIAGLAEHLQATLPAGVIVSVEERVYVVMPEVPLFGRSAAIIPDLRLRGAGTISESGTAVLTPPVPVLAPIPEVVRERYLELRDTQQVDKILTVIEVLSPANKRPGPGRAAYLEKRLAVLSSDTSLVEIDVLRAGERMAVIEASPRPGYRAFVSAGDTRPHASLYPFTVRDPLPVFPVPVQPGAPPASVDLGSLLAVAYQRGNLAQRVDYSREPTPPLPPADAAWATALLHEQGF
jgi:hypothetical protein